MSFTDITSAMGWSGTYSHCVCCNADCPMTHYAPCVIPAHDDTQPTDPVSS